MNLNDPSAFVESTWKMEFSNKPKERNLKNFSNSPAPSLHLLPDDKKQKKEAEVSQ